MCVKLQRDSLQWNTTLDTYYLCHEIPGSLIMHNPGIMSGRMWFVVWTIRFPTKKLFYIKFFNSGGTKMAIAKLAEFPGIFYFHSTSVVLLFHFFLVLFFSSLFGLFFIYWSCGCGDLMDRGSTFHHRAPPEFCLDTSIFILIITQKFLFLCHNRTLDDLWWHDTSWIL